MGVMGFLHTEGLRSVSLERWEGVPGGRGNRARSTDTILQGEQPQRLVRRVQSAGQGADKRGERGLLAITAAVPSGWHSLPQPQLSVQTQTGPAGAQQET